MGFVSAWALLFWKLASEIFEERIIRGSGPHKATELCWGRCTMARWLQVSMAELFTGDIFRDIWLTCILPHCCKQQTALLGVLSPSTSNSNVWSCFLSNSDQVWWRNRAIILGCRLYWICYSRSHFGMPADNMITMSENMANFSNFAPVSLNKLA